MASIYIIPYKFGNRNSFSSKKVIIGLEANWILTWLQLTCEMARYIMYNNTARRYSVSWSYSFQASQCSSCLHIAIGQIAKQQILLYSHSYKEWYSESWKAQISPDRVKVLFNMHLRAGPDFRIHWRIGSITMVSSSHTYMWGQFSSGRDRTSQACKTPEYKNAESSFLFRFVVIYLSVSSCLTHLSTRYDSGS